jgi:hypothetical protein
MSTFGTDKDNELYIMTLFGFVYRLVDVTVDADVPAVPELTLTAAPNPFHGVATFRFAVPDHATNARVEIFDVKGRRVRVLSPRAGAAEVLWRGRNDAGQRLASGVYFARLMVDGQPMAHQRVVLVR